MKNSAQNPNRNLIAIFRPATAALAIAIVFALMMVVTQSAQAQTFTVLHSFTGGGDGALPQAGITMDGAGNLYGTTTEGGDPMGRCGATGCGTVFKLSRNGSSWVLKPLYSFTGFDDGLAPWGRVTIAPDGTLYGTTNAGGVNGGGTVFHLSPSPSAPKSALASWNETVLYNFTSDGFGPTGDLTLDQSGNIYGAATYGGVNDNGITYELARSGGAWTETTIYSQSYGDEAYPRGGVIFDHSGNLYGVLDSGGLSGLGAVYQLSPSGSSWTEQTIYNFYEYLYGIVPAGGLLADSSGNLYGTTWAGGSMDGGTVFELTPTNGGWTFSTLYNLSGCRYCGPQDKLVMDAAGNLYGTTSGGGAQQLGTVFKLTPSNGGWSYTSLHDFTGGSDGATPYGPVLDANGNLYGTTFTGGLPGCLTGGSVNGCGVVWKITP